MEIQNAMSIHKPDPDGHFRLLNCGCGSDNVAYVEQDDGSWAVWCFDCNRVATDPRGFCRHGIQNVWNGGGRYA